MSLFMRRAAIAPLAVSALLAACQSNAQPIAFGGGLAAGCPRRLFPLEVPSRRLRWPRYRWKSSPSPNILTACIDIPYPPQEFFDDQGNPIGSDIEIGQEIAQPARARGRDR